MLLCEAMKCPSPGCNAANFNSKIHGDNEYIVCENGHVVSIGFRALAAKIEEVAADVCEQIQADGAATRKKIQDILDKLSNN